MTFGCAHNFADGEYMKVFSILQTFKYRVFFLILDILLWKTVMMLFCGMQLSENMLNYRILNSCTVKDPSEAAFRNLVVEAENKGKKLVLAGCVPQGNE